MLIPSLINDGIFFFLLPTANCQLLTGIRPFQKNRHRPRPGSYIMMAVFQFEVGDIFPDSISFQPEFIDKVKRIIDGINNAILIPVPCLIHIAALKKEFKAGMINTVPDPLVNDAVFTVIIFFIRLIQAAPPE